MTPHADTHHHHDHQHAQHHGDGLTEMLDLDAQVMHRYLSDAMDWLASLVPDPTRILDLGAGTGTGTIALAHRFPAAEIVAVDRSDQMLARTGERIRAAAATERVSTVRADLDQSWPDLGHFDLAWTSAAVHELADPDRAFTQLCQLLQPAGVLTVVEIDAPPRFLDDAVGDGVEHRIHQALRRAQPGSNNYPDWTEKLHRAGFDTVRRRSFAVDQPLPTDGIGGRYAQTYLRRVQPAVRGHLSAADNAFLDALVADDGEQSLLHRSDLRLRAGRSAWEAHRSR